VPTLWLIGMMGSGKTTIGPIVAGRLGLPWFDTDGEVSDLGGASAAEIVAADESRFRTLERAAVDSLAGRAAVGSCGGGVVLDDRCVDRMRATGLVVWLCAPIDVLAARVRGGEDRPLLGPDVAGSLEAVAAARRLRYEKAAHVVVDAAEEPDWVADQVVETWKNSS
jgi:shikimate kinase